MNRFEVTRRVGLLGVFGNIFLFIIKIIVGLTTNSQSMIADAINSAGDVFASFMTTIGNKISSVPNDDDHNFGHGKAEYIFSLFISMSIIILSLKIFYDSIKSIIIGSHLNFSFYLIVVGLITILIKLLLFLYARSKYKGSDNILIYSSMIDHRNDCLITMCAMISIIFSCFGIYFVDGIVGIGISIWIIRTGILLFIDSYKVLMDTSIDNDTKNEIIKMISYENDVLGVREFYSIPTGYKYVIVVTIDVSGRISTKKSHQIADNIELKIKKNFEKVEHIIVHVHPV